MRKTEIKSKDIIKKIENLPKYIKDKMDCSSLELSFDDDIRITSILPVSFKANDRADRNEQPTLYYKGIAITNKGLMEVVFPRLPLVINSLTMSCGKDRFVTGKKLELIISGDFNEDEAFFHLFPVGQLDDEVKEVLCLNE